jgi:hypothetical protein
LHRTRRIAAHPDGRAAFAMRDRPITAFSSFHRPSHVTVGVELLILDNLSSLTVSVRENDGDSDSDSWAQIQDWLLRLRRRGISVLILAAWRNSSGS